MEPDASYYTIPVCSEYYFVFYVIENSFIIKGSVPVTSQHGLLTTVAYQLGKESPPIYALEGSVAIAGAAIRWFNSEQFNIISNEFTF